jgi:apolipoprotein D and lipocalin family protein
MRTARIWILALLLFLQGGCASPPEGLSPVSGFDASRYLGTWYEIARYDHSFERGLTHAWAHYSMGGKGKIQVVNYGYDPEKETWREIRGTARLAGDPDRGSLLVTFFPPFEAGYHVIALDREKYRWAVVAGPNRKYLWLLARTRKIDGPTRAKLVKLVEEAGYDPDGLIWVPQDSPPPFLVDLPVVAPAASAD